MWRRQRNGDTLAKGGESALFQVCIGCLPAEWPPCDTPRRRFALGSQKLSFCVASSYRAPNTPSDSAVFPAKKCEIDVNCAEVRAGASLGGKIRKLTPNALRSAREVLDDSNECWGEAGGGAKRRHVSRRFEGRKIRKSTSNAPRLTADASKYFSHDLRVRRSHPLALYPSGELGEAFLRPSRRAQGQSQRTSQGLLSSSSSRTTSNMLGSDRSSSGEQGIPFAPFAFAYPVFPLRLPAPLGDEYTYRRPPSEDPCRSPPPSDLDCATLLVLNFVTISEVPARPATPSILVSNNNTPRGLGADAHNRSLRTSPKSRGFRLRSAAHPSRRRATALVLSM
ncbi:hypothetical protein EV714DRAFT_239437 [Schizophyllum commune]